ncbi:hypothetical protein AGMMS49587_14400 [Spirochaetia bacterium]|nr:hypothetical protein AGMMS49587_14400 [Spirochaetia bacterium]
MDFYHGKKIGFNLDCVYIMLVELSGQGLPILSRPFRFASNQRPKILKVPEDDVIQERDGVHFINDSVFKPDRDVEKNLDSKFKDLVDSVLMKR